MSLRAESSVNRRIIGAYHVATFPHWSVIAEAQCLRVNRSGLLDKTSKILVGVVGDPNEDVSMLSDLLGPSAVVRHLGPLSSFEFPTLQWLYEEVQDDNFACWYIHTKGASARRADQTVSRLKMESVILDQHERCLDVLKTHDTCGTGWTFALIGQHPHYAGNFWWANSRYLRTLPAPSTLLTSNRHNHVGPPALAVTSSNFGRGEAELWIGRNQRIRPFNVVAD